MPKNASGINKAARKTAPKKAARKKTTRKKAPNKKKGFPFPFFGSGDARYFEFVNLLLVFERPVSKVFLTWARTLLPPVLKDSLDRQKEGENWLRLFMGEEWGGTFFEERPMHRINQAIEDWLKKLHQKAPIVCAFRPEDAEADGTEYDEWHLWSLDNPPDPELIETIPSPVGSCLLPEALQQMKKDTLKWQRRISRRRRSRKKPEKGNRVKITSGRERGARGEIFWVGQSQYQDEPRYGIRDGQNTYWVNASQVELMLDG